MSSRLYLPLPILPGRGRTLLFIDVALAVVVFVAAITMTFCIPANTPYTPQTRPIEQGASLQKDEWKCTRALESGLRTCENERFVCVTYGSVTSDGWGSYGASGLSCFDKRLDDAKP